MTQLDSHVVHATLVLNKMKIWGSFRTFIRLIVFSEVKNKLHFCVSILLESAVRLVTSLTVVIEPRKIKILAQCGELVFVRIVERKILFNYLDSDY